MTKKSKAKRKAKKQDVLIKRVPRVDPATGDTLIFDISLEREHKEAGKDEEVQLSFEVTLAFRWNYKVFAFKRDLTMQEMFIESFELYKKVYPCKDKDN